MTQGRSSPRGKRNAFWVSIWCSSSVIPGEPNVFSVCLYACAAEVDYPSPVLVVNAADLRRLLA